MPGDRGKYEIHDILVKKGCKVYIAVTTGLLKLNKFAENRVQSLKHR